MLGCTVVARAFDDGMSVAIFHGPSGTGFRRFVLWDEQPRTMKRLQTWLNTLPWPTDDDPRVIHTGAYA
jgi:hypothetical protein